VLPCERRRGLLQPMIVRRLLIASHPLLQQAAQYLASVTPPQAFDVAKWERGDWRADFDGPPPTSDRPQPLAFRRMRMESAARVDGWGDAKVSALNYYPVGGGGLGWHTDTGHPGWRVYMPRLLGGGAPGVFRTAGADYVDERGTALAFWISGEPMGSWHAVRTYGARLSLGIRFTDGPTQRALGLST